MQGERVKRSLLIFFSIVVITFFLLYYFKYQDYENKNIREYISYDTEGAITNAIRNIKEGSEKAEIIEGIHTNKGVLSLNFIGLSTEQTNDSVRTILEEHNVDATFFVPGIVAAEDNEFIENLRKDGHRIGSNSLSGEKKMEDSSIEELVQSFVSSNAIIQKWVGKNDAILLYCNSTQYSDKVLQTAYASGNEKVVKSDYILNYRSFNSYEQTLDYMKKIPRGSIILFKMNGELDEIEYGLNQKDNKAAEDKAPSLDDGVIDQYSEKERLLTVIKWILKALDEVKVDIVLTEELSNHIELGNGSDSILNSESQDELDDENEDINISDYFVSEANRLREMNSGNLASTTEILYTVEPAVGYSFYGVSNTEVLDNILNKLSENSIRSTFFISINDIEEYRDNMDKVVKAGHELQIMLLESNGKDYVSVARNIIKIKNHIKDNYNQDAKLVRYPYEIKYTKDALEAISATECRVIGQNISVASWKLDKDSTVDEIMDGLFHAGNKYLSRGEIVYFRLDYYNDKNIIASLIEKIKTQKVDTIGYSFNTLRELADSEYIYKYPLESVDILPQVFNKIGRNHLIDVEDTLMYITKRFIGTPTSKSILSLPGFTEEEVEMLNNTGRFTDDKVIFLTFDDWGTDGSINKLLYILNKYKIKGSFFIRTNYIEANPNLLRAMALHGHDIASHTDSHYVLANTTDKIGVFAELDNNQRKELQDDIILSYKKMQNIIGDILIEGRPALQTYFRPPALAISRSGLYSVFDSGFSYSISGDFSTRDYEVTSSEELILRMQNGMSNSEGEILKIENGSVVIMHMSEESKYTAEALDKVIPYYLSKGYKFARISDYLQ